jgi:hypothetical protein
VSREFYCSGINFVPFDKRATTTELESPECKAKHSEVLAALARIEQITTMSHPARGAVKVIKQLLRESHRHVQGLYSDT